MTCHLSDAPKAEEGSLRSGKPQRWVYLETYHDHIQVPAPYNHFTGHFLRQIDERLGPLGLLIADMDSETQPSAGGDRHKQGKPRLASQSPSLPRVTPMLAGGTVSRRCRASTREPPLARRLRPRAQGLTTRACRAAQQCPRRLRPACSSRVRRRGAAAHAHGCARRGPQIRLTGSLEAGTLDVCSCFPRERETWRKKQGVGSL